VAGIDAGAEAVMMAHVTYPAVAPEPAGYAPRWLRDILRDELGFGGVVFSDDIGMAAANTAGGVPARIHAHLDAGCDVVLVCAPALVAESLAAMDGRAADVARLDVLRGRGSRDWHGLATDSRYDSARTALSALSPAAFALLTSLVTLPAAGLFVLLAATAALVLFLVLWHFSCLPSLF